MEGTQITAHLSIIGNGNMGRAISGVATAGGNSVEVFGKADADKPVNGYIVVLAVPPKPSVSCSSRSPPATRFRGAAASVSSPDRPSLVQRLPLEYC